MRTAGFSLIELVSVIVILGVLSAFVVPRLNTSGFDAFAFRERVLSAARYAQKTAMASSCEVQLAADAGADTVTLAYRNGGTDTTCGPDGNAFDDRLSNPRTGEDFVLTVSNDSQADITSGGTLVYDAFGRADSGLTIGLDPGADVVIEQETGYARQSP